MFDLLPPSRDAAIIGRLRSAHPLPIPRTHRPTSKYRPFIHYGLTHYQPNLKWIISLSNNSYSSGNQNWVLYVVVIAGVVTAFFCYFVFVWVRTDCMFRVKFSS